MLEVQGLFKSFGHTHALRDVNLQVEDGQLLTIVGPNGAGKTTLLRILAALLRPTQGQIRIDGLVLDVGNAFLRRRIGFLSDRPIVYDHLTAEENLVFYARLFEVQDVPQRVARLLDLVGLTARRHDLARTLSRGMQQRLSLARSLIHEPAILLLDEPFAGLDQEAIAMLHGLLQADGRPARTVVMATHNMEQGLAWCDQLIMLSAGRVVYSGERTALSLDGLYQAYQEHARAGVLKRLARA